jgi:glutamine synthetase adenylyltransferase
VECTTDDIAESIRTATRSDPPDEQRLIDILRLFARKGALRLGERDKVEKITPLMVLPGITVLSPDTWMDQVRSWGAARGEEAF